MRFVQAGRVAAMVGLLLFATACSSETGTRGAPRLAERLQLRLAPDIVAGRATLEQLSDGARVTITDQALFPGSSTELDDNGRFTLASVIEGLLAPRILRVQMIETATAPAGMQEARARAVAEFFEDYGLGPTLQPPLVQSAAPPGAVVMAPQGMAIVITIIAS
jgi:hypothetical protein